MFEFLKKKPPVPPAKEGASAPAEAPVRTGWSPEELASAFDVVQEEKAARAAAEKAARLEAEKAQAREQVRETMGSSLLARTLGGLFSGNPRLDEDLLEELETALLSADVGVTATSVLVVSMR